MTSGYEANHSGGFLEQVIMREFVARGALPLSPEKAENLDLFNPFTVARQVPYTNMMGAQARRDFVVSCFERTICLECRYQNMSGSVWEKFPYLLRNSIEAIPEQEIGLIIDGAGTPPEAVAWLKREAKKAPKKICVMNINEFMAWSKTEFSHQKSLRVVA